MVPRSEQRSEIDTDAYFGGIVYPNDASVNPAALLLGQLHSARAAGAIVVGHCPVVHIERRSRDFLITTPKGKVRARDVIIATNGYTGSLTPWHRQRVIPIGSYIIATEPLEDGQMDRLIPKDRVIGDTRKVVFYYRSSPDRTRMIFGGRVSAAETDPLVSAPRLHARMAEIFPELKRTRVSHSWFGFVAFTFDTLAHLGNHDGLYYAMGYCGSGVSMASYLGTRIGQQVLGSPEGQTAFDDLPFQSRPFYSGVPWFLSASVSYFRLLDRFSR
jgi:glycine/D-amino acid oxidase-like deaminating enzyme